MMLLLPQTVMDIKKGVAVERKKTGFTMVELLAVLGIIALLVGLLLPALSTVRNMAKETKQKAQFTSIELALTTFKNDYGDYPPSSWSSTSNLTNDYCGAQKLAEALFGWDLLGFHPKTAWRADGLDAANGPGTYDPLKTRDLDGNGVPDTLDERKGRYLELATTSAFKLGDVFRPYSTGPLAPDAYVICDAFTAKKVTMSKGIDPVTGQLITVTEKAGAPILYYKANTSQKTINTIYDVLDNHALVVAKQQADNREHPLARQVGTGQYQSFYDYIRNPKIDARPWPYRADSYILISAGADGLYGTGDDICNFGN
jgi:prepilin-type N-terminal cleavage/methylation domain-containing protein